MGAEIAAILQYAGTHGPFLLVIGFLLRSSARKDTVIENLTAQAQHMVSESREMASEVRSNLTSSAG